MNGKKLRESEMLFARELAAQAWCKEETKHTDMDVNLAEAFAEILVKEMYDPHLGCATTEELLDEVKARVDLNYKTTAKVESLFGEVAEGDESEGE